MRANVPELDPSQNPDLISRIDTIIERDGGLIEAYVPIELVNHEDVPVDAEHVIELAESIKKESDKHDTLGQLTPVLLADVEGRDRFAIIDGFHRVPALKSLGKTTVYATVKVDCSWEDVVDLRIVTAKSHKSVRFSRIVEWVEEAWGKSQWGDKVGVGSAFQMAFLGTNGRNSGVTPEETQEIRDWVNRKCEQWGISAPQVDRYLRTARQAAPELVKAARERKSGRKLEALTPRHLTEMVRYLPDQHDLQRRVAATAIANALTVPQIKALSLAVSKAENSETVEEYIDGRVWERMSSARTSLTKKRYPEIDPGSPESLLGTLIDKFFDDQVIVAQLMIENAILTGSYMPKQETADDRINTLLFESDVDIREDVIDLSEGHLEPWATEKVTAVAEKVFEMNGFLSNFVNRKYGLGHADIEDVVSVATMRFLTRANDGRLPQEYEDDLHLRRLMTKIVGYAAIDHIRNLKGRKGQKQAAVSLDHEDKDGYKIYDTLVAPDEDDLTIETSNFDFIKNTLPYLSERERRVMVLKGYFGLTAFDMAQVIGTTEGTINQHIQTIKRKVQKLSEKLQLNDAS